MSIYFNILSFKYLCPEYFGEGYKWEYSLQINMLTNIFKIIFSYIWIFSEYLGRGWEYSPQIINFFDKYLLIKVIFFILLNFLIFVGDEMNGCQSCSVLFHKRSNRKHGK